MVFFRRSFLVSVIVFLASSCAHYDYNKPTKPTHGEDKMPPATELTVGVSVMEVGGGEFAFKYSGEYFEENGDFDFSEGPVSKGPVEITFVIDEAPDGVVFRSPGADAIWIDFLQNVGPEGSPKGPYRGDQFRDFRTIEGGKALRVFDVNNDGEFYRYGLRFDRRGELIMHDPTGHNGGGWDN
ncbi:MAG: hypothetical protein AAGB02_06005 [Pseudomonadota bacterium]